MKKIVFLLCLLCSAAALAQYSSNVAAEFGQQSSASDQFESHPGQAAYAAMSQERSILPSSTYLSAQGERRASDFAQPESVSLGTIARELRNSTRTWRRNRSTVWINQ